MSSKDVSNGDSGHGERLISAGPSPPSAGVHGGDELLDITLLIEECASLLTVSEPFVCNTESFSLHNSMTATELTDRKMDCLEIPASHYTGSSSDDDRVVFPRPVPQGLDDPFALLPWEQLTCREASYIALKMIACLQSFISGSSAVESTFTCLYAHASVLHDMQTRLFADAPLVEPIEPPGPDRYNQFFLFACAMALVDATDMVRTVVVNADIYEEEDFSPNTYDIPIYTENVDVPIVLNLLEAAMKLTTEAGLEQNLLEFNQCILGYLIGFLSVCGSLSKLTATSLRIDIERIQRECRLTVGRLEQLEDALPTVAFENDASLDRLDRQTFDPYVNRPLVGNTPVRKPVSRPAVEAIRFLRTVTSELDWAVCDLLLRGTSLARVQRMLDRVQRSDVNILNRSFVILNLYFEDMLLGQHPLVPLIAENLCQWRDLPDSFMEFELTLAFLDRLAKPIYDSLKLRLLNRCRQQNYIEVVMLNDWIALQNEAHVIDMHYNREHSQAEKGSLPPFLSQYVLVYMLRIMDRHLAVGLELEIYRSNLDISMMYWYRDFLLSALLNNLSTMRATKSLIKDPVAAGDKSGKAKKNPKSKQQRATLEVQQRQQELYAEQQEDSFDMMLISVQRDLCRGLKRFLAVLQQADVVRIPEYQFTSPERIFEERFAVFALVAQPPPLIYNDFVQGSDYSHIEAHDLLSTTTKCFSNSKNIVDRLLQQDVRQLDAAYTPLQETELRALLKVCVGNNVYLLKLKSVIESSATFKAKVSVLFEGKSQFCTIKITS